MLVCLRTHLQMRLLPHCVHLYFFLDFPCQFWPECYSRLHIACAKGAVTTALHAHSMRKRLVRLKKDRFTPPLPPCPPQVSFPFHIAPAQDKISLFSFIVFGINFARARFVFAPLCSGVAFANNLSQPILPWGPHPP